MKNIIIGGNVSDPGKLGYLTCNRIQIYPPPSAIQNTMVAISALHGSSQNVRCRYIATVKALTKMKEEVDMKRGVHIDSKLGKVGLVILVDMSTNMVPTESNKGLKLTRKKLNVGSNHQFILGRLKTAV